MSRFLQLQVHSNSKPLYWQYTVGNTRVEFNDVPFSIGENKILDCQHGSHYYKRKKSMGKRVKLQGTRKMDCAAHIVCHQYIIYPDYAISNAEREMFTTKRNERDMKEKKLNELRDCLKSGGVKSVIKYYISLPTEEAHHKAHLTRGAHVMAQRINPDISKKIYELVQQDGITDIQEVRKVLNHYVRTSLCSHPPDSDDRAYFPSSRDIKNHIYLAKRALELSKLDQENLAKKISEWEKLYPESQHYFRP